MNTNTNPSAVSAAEYRARQLGHFLGLDPEQKRQAIQRLAGSGMHETTIAAATALSVEMIQRILAERAAS
jgi:hypothetical protein